MKKSLFTFLLIGSALSISTAFASLTQDAYQHTHWHIVNNTGQPLYITNSVLGGTWRTHIPMQTAMPISSNGTYSNLLTSLKMPFNHEEQGQADIEVCTKPLMHDGQAYCYNVNNFCTLYAYIDSKHAPHHYANVNMQSGALSCNVQKQITSDGMSVTFTVNQS